MSLMIYPRPKAGDVYRRNAPHGEEEALVVSVGSRPGNDEWLAFLYTPRGADQISGSGVQAGPDAWHPDGWEWSDEEQAFVAPESPKTSKPRSTGRGGRGAGRRKSAATVDGDALVSKE